MISGWIRGAPLRKILALAITPIWVLVVLWSLRHDIDIPRNTHDLLSTMCMVVFGGYFGTSAWETTSALKHGKNDSEKPPEEEETGDE